MAWAASWVDWENRFKEVKKRIDQISKTLETPRSKQ
jgi:hypothetical protein